MIDKIGQKNNVISKNTNEKFDNGPDKNIEKQIDENTSKNNLNYLVVEVCLPILIARNFDYLLSDSDAKIAKVGMAVKVAFGRKSEYKNQTAPIKSDINSSLDTNSISDADLQSKSLKFKNQNNNSKFILGIILELKSTSDYAIEKLKPVEELIEQVCLSKQQIEFYRFTSRYYVTSLGMVLRAALPKLVRRNDNLIASFLSSYQISEAGKKEIDHLPKNAKKKHALLTAIKTPQQIDYLKKFGFTNSDCRKLVDSGLATEKKTSPYLSIDSNYEFLNKISLNDEQKKAVNDIAHSFDKYSATLLFGVTGSGKTEIYIRLIQIALLQQKQVLLLVPEIGLTPQMIDRFSNRFPKLVDTYHSSMNDIARKNVFLHANSGDLPILIGTRSAIFLPIKNLGLILIDEEHDSSYKQQDGFRYHARDLALLRAKQFNIPIVLGSATPSLESLHNVKLDKLKQINLMQRATNANLPKIVLLDMRRQIMSANDVVAQPVVDKIRQVVARGEQALLFLNRRGYSPVMICNNCGWSSNCENCSTHKTAHINKRKLICHHCGDETNIPTQCPECHDSLQFIGSGTEKLEQFIALQFPNSRILRLDRDNQTTAKQLADALDQIISGEVDIILGTQLVVKGHHFPNLTFVCAVDCDQALYSSDFRAEEHLLQQLIQVAGRAGRELTNDCFGELLIQTYLPDHPVFSALLKHDYIDYAKELLKKRKQYIMPPVGAMSIIRANYHNQDELFNYLRKLGLVLETQYNELAKKSNLESLLRILGPVPSAIERKNKLYYANLIIESDTRSVLQKQLLNIKNIMQQLDKTNRYKAFVDVDPYDF